MRNTFYILVFSIILSGFISDKNLYSQTISLVPEPGFTEYATYYISSFDLQTGASNFQLFRFRLKGSTYPVYGKINFIASLMSPTLNLNNETTIVDVESEPFQMTSDILLVNQDFSSNTTQLLDVTGNAIPLSVRINESMDVSQFDQILSALLTTGRLADGHYSFRIQIYSGNTEDALSLTDTEEITIVVESPSYINLESPGGALADTSLNEIYNTFPLFTWYPQVCSQCNMLIRLAEFNPSIHSSIDDAIEDETMLPFNQTEDWESIGNVTSFQYPVSDARLLEHNKIYVWQVKATLPTTAGNEEIISSIFAFKIGDIGGSTPIPQSVNPVIQLLGQAFTSDQFNSLFGPGGSLEGFTPTGLYSVNGNTSDQSSIMAVINRIISQNAVITNISVED